MAEKKHQKARSKFISPFTREVSFAAGTLSALFGKTPIGKAETMISLYTGKLNPTVLIPD